jgi:hypothetical protein
MTNEFDVDEWEWRQVAANSARRSVAISRPRRRRSLPVQRRIDVVEERPIEERTLVELLIKLLSPTDPDG